MNTRVCKSLFIVELYTEIPSLFSLLTKMLEAWFDFDFLLTFNVKVQNLKKVSFNTNKSIVFIIN